MPQSAWIAQNTEFYYAAEHKTELADGTDFFYPRNLDGNYTAACLRWKTKTGKTPDAFLSLSACCSALLCPYENEFSTASANHFNSVANTTLRKASGHKPRLLHKLNKQTMRTATYNPELKT